MRIGHQRAFPVAQRWHGKLEFSTFQSDARTWIKHNFAVDSLLIQIGTVQRPLVDQPVRMIAILDDRMSTPHRFFLHHDALDTRALLGLGAADLNDISRQHVFGFFGNPV